ncbi:hypothetical protein MNKW57_11360 [Biformimicrobium ophioploci]|uniref:Aspartyl/asparaginy/proline hydroxylase domain-containing protein n=2 Tax=Biformimicrobium ophioploci TaxID=3036711 RepID=A0ABQ6LXL1_9GAMM|nr:hypothetical protein MNKW57_11360 [Microbulbifer sp. NKW57]
MKVAGRTFHWEEGKCLIFDDSLTHEVWNCSSKNRVVLLFDFWHPDLSEAERKTLGMLDSLTNYQNQYTDHIVERQRQLVREIYQGTEEVKKR